MKRSGIALASALAAVWTASRAHLILDRCTLEESGGNPNQGAKQVTGEVIDCTLKGTCKFPKSFVLRPANKALDQVKEAVK